MLRSADQECALCGLQGLVVFDIDGEKWTLDLTPGSRSVKKGAPEGKPDLTLTISDENFVKLVMGKIGPQQVIISIIRSKCPRARI
jgi:putative sterol carrier protein